MNALRRDFFGEQQASCVQNAPIDFLVSSPRLHIFEINCVCYWIHKLILYVLFLLREWTGIQWRHRKEINLATDFEEFQGRPFGRARGSSPGLPIHLNFSQLQRAMIDNPWSNAQRSHSKFLAGRFWDTERIPWCILMRLILSVQWGGRGSQRSTNASFIAQAVNWHHRK